MKCSYCPIPGSSPCAGEAMPGYCSRVEQESRMHAFDPSVPKVWAKAVIDKTGRGNLTPPINAVPAHEEWEPPTEGSTWSRILVHGRPSMRSHRELTETFFNEETIISWKIEDEYDRGYVRRRSRFADVAITFGQTDSVFDVNPQCRWILWAGGDPLFVQSALSMAGYADHVVVDRRAYMEGWPAAETDNYWTVINPLPRKIERAPSDGKFHVVFLGEASHSRGFTLFMRAAEALKGHRDEIQFSVVTNTPMPFKSHAVQYYKDESSSPPIPMDLVVLPSVSHDPDWIDLDVMASGIPILATPHGAVDKFNVFAQTIQELNEGVLIQKILAAKDDPDRESRAAMGEKVIKESHIYRFQESWREVVRKVLTAPSRRSERGFNPVVRARVSTSPAETIPAVGSIPPPEEPVFRQDLLQIAARCPHKKLLPVELRSGCSCTHFCAAGVSTREHGKVDGIQCYQCAKAGGPCTQGA